MTKDTLDKLEFAFSIGCTDEEACLHAGINPATLYKYQKENPEYIERKDALKQKTLILARQTVLEKVGDSYQNSMDYLKRKRRIEFGDNVDVSTMGEKVTFNLVTDVAQKYATNPSADDNSAKPQEV